MASGGDVFVLDMGEPVKIDDLARTMIRLMGREVRDEDNPDGDIAIEYVGPRDGEKLYEELLIGENVIPTEHPRILRSREPFLPKAKLEPLLDELAAALEEDSAPTIKATLARAVENYRPAQHHLNGSEPFDDGAMAA
jgi:FlaA1/EpsC-like NDP-sugar epimerase